MKQIILNTRNSFGWPLLWLLIIAQNRKWESFEMFMQRNGWYKCGWFYYAQRWNRHF